MDQVTDALQEHVSISQQLSKMSLLVNNKHAVLKWLHRRHYVYNSKTTACHTPAHHGIYVQLV